MQVSVHIGQQIAYCKGPKNLSQLLFYESQSNYDATPFN